MNTYRYTISDYYLPALINNDYSGMEDQEILALDAFQAWVIEQHGHGHWSCDCDIESSFDRCNICNLLAECIDIEWVVI